MENVVRADEELQKKRRYTYADYLEWKGLERYELYDVFTIGGASGDSCGVIIGFRQSASGQVM